MTPLYTPTRFHVNRSSSLGGVHGQTDTQLCYYMMIGTYTDSICVVNVPPLTMSEKKLKAGLKNQV